MGRTACFLVLISMLLAMGQAVTEEERREEAEQLEIKLEKDATQLQADIDAAGRVIRKDVAYYKKIGKVPDWVKEGDKMYKEKGLPPVG